MIIPHLTVIIPVRNEAEELSRLLDELRQQQGVALELLVADGGSRDRGQEIALAMGADWIDSPPGRGAQMNTAAAKARSPLLLFLHADSHLPHPRLLAEAVVALTTARNRETVPVAGHFALSFATRDPELAGKLRFHAAKSALNRPGCFNGDQGLLIFREDFDALGRFDTSLPYLEDHRLARRIHAQGRWITLPGALVTSARRFEEEGYRPRTLLNLLILTLDHAGAGSLLAELPGLYREQRRTGPLRLTPFLQRVVRQYRDTPSPHRREVRRTLAQYTRQQAWQLFLWAGVHHTPETPLRYLAWHDRWFDLLTDNRMGQELAWLVMVTGFHTTRIRWARRERENGLER